MWRRAGALAVGAARLRNRPAQTAARLGDYPDFVALLDLLEERLPDDATAHALVANVASVTSATVLGDEGLDPEHRSEWAEQLALFAVDEVRLAIDLGYESLQSLETTAELDPLRSRPDFQSQLDRLR